MTRVQGQCPMGCGETLFVGEGGYVTCSWFECPEPDAASNLLAGGDWTADDGRANSSQMYAALSSDVAGLIRDSAWSLLRGDSEGVGRIIVARLAHVHGLAPRTARQPSGTPQRDNNVRTASADCFCTPPKRLTINDEQQSDRCDDCGVQLATWPRMSAPDTAPDGNNVRTGDDPVTLTIPAVEAWRLVHLLDTHGPSEQPMPTLRQQLVDQLIPDQPGAT